MDGTRFLEAFPKSDPSFSESFPRWKSQIKDLARDLQDFTQQTLGLYSSVGALVFLFLTVQFRAH